MKMGAMEIITVTSPTESIYILEVSLSLVKDTLAVISWASFNCGLAFVYELQLYLEYI